MEKESFYIDAVPITVYGKPSDKAFIYVHGLGGDKSEGERFAIIAEKYGYRTLAIDLPEHGGRTDGAKLLPWEVVPELDEVNRYASERYKEISVRATSIGAYFSLLSFARKKIKKCLLVSPLVDMVDMIESMMKRAQVSEERLLAEGEITTDFNQTLSYRYLKYARENPIKAICFDTRILFALGDELINKRTIDKFCLDNDCEVTFLKGGEHWLHKEEDVARMEEWEEKPLRED